MELDQVPSPQNPPVESEIAAQPLAAEGLPREHKIVLLSLYLILGTIVVAVVYLLIQGGYWDELTFRLREPNFKCSDQSPSYKDLNVALSEPLAVCRLDLSSQNLESIPGNVSRMKNLTELYLRGNRITVLPEFIRSLDHLKVLDLSNNKLTEIPIWVGQMQSIESLSFGYNRLSSVPYQLFDSQTLVRISLRNNFLADLPTNVVSSPKLETIGLANNKLSVLPQGLTKLKTLIELSLAGNSNIDVSQIGQLRQLEDLDLSDTDLASLPSTIANLTKLKRLVLVNDKFTQEGINRLGQLLPQTQIVVSQ